MALLFLFISGFVNSLAFLPLVVSGYGFVDSVTFLSLFILAMFFVDSFAFGFVVMFTLFLFFSFTSFGIIVTAVTSFKQVEKWSWNCYR